MDVTTGGPAEITRFTNIVYAPATALPALMSICAVYGPSSSEAILGRSTVTQIGAYEPVLATPLVCKVGNCPLPFTRIHTGDAAPPRVPAPLAIEVVTV